MPHKRVPNGPDTPPLGDAIADMMQADEELKAATANLAALETKVMAHRPKPLGPFPQEAVDGFRAATEVEGTFALLITWNPEANQLGLGHNAPSDEDALGIIGTKITEWFALRMAEYRAVAATITANLEDAAEAQRQALEAANGDPASKIILPGTGVVAANGGKIILPH